MEIGIVLTVLIRPFMVPNGPEDEAKGGEMRDVTGDEEDVAVADGVGGDGRVEQS